MPHFSLQLSPQGPIVDAGMTVSTARQQALVAQNLAIPPPQIVRGLIDTGAGLSAVDPSVLQALGLNPTGEAEIFTPTTGGIPVKIPTYDVCIAILAGRTGDVHFISDTIQVTGASLTAQGLGYQVLIGRDILKSCILYFNGADGVFSLSY